MARPETTRGSRRWRKVPPDHRLPAARGGEDRVEGPAESAGRHAGSEPRRTGGEAEGRPGIGALLRSLAEDMSTLVRQEIRLARMEAGRTAKRVAVDGAWIGTGAAIMAVGGLCLVLALALGLGALLGSYWLGTLVTGLLLIGVGALTAWKGARDLRSGNLGPTDTIETMRENQAWARQEARELRDDLTGGGG